MNDPIHPIFFRLLWLSAALLAACTPDEPPLKPWREELTVIISSSGNKADTGFESQLVTLFAEQLQVKTRLISLPPHEIIPALLNGRAHIAAAGIRSNANSSVRFGPAYQTVSEHFACSVSLTRRRTRLQDKRIAVVAGSAQETLLLEMQSMLPELRWESRRNQTVDSLLAEAAESKYKCAVANEEQLALARNYHPGLDSALSIASPSRLAWAFPPDGNEELFFQTQDFFRRIKQDGTLHSLLDRFYGHNERLGQVDAVAFITGTRTILPHYRSLFEEAATLTGLEWELLAAVGYQESHWNPLATSRTNVRGMMMLTEETADRMNVSNRLDARQSIMAGARYLQLLKEQLPLRIDEPDRTWLALAAYNQGSSHLEDARILAKSRGLNPDMWINVKKTLPLLAQPQYFEKLKHGRARGGEAVVFVETVRLHYDMLKHLGTSDVPRLRTRNIYLPFIE